MSVAIVIPARMASKRFPGKPLVPLQVNGVEQPLLRRTWDTACNVAPRDRIWIATDHPDIAAVAIAFGAQVAMTVKDCRNGTERCADAVATAAIEADIIVNLQGDAPLSPDYAITAVIAAMRSDPTIAVATASVPCSKEMLERLREGERRGIPSGTTVVTRRNGDALYFSRCVLPYFNAELIPASVRFHIGIYAYRRSTLQTFRTLAVADLERLEDLEQLRWLDAGVAIRVVTVEHPDHELCEVNLPQDVAVVEAALAIRHSAQRRQS